MPNDLTIRPFEDQDLPAVLDVLRVALGEPEGLGRTPELFAWKHIDNPHGPSIMLVAEEHGRIAGFRAFMQWRMMTPDGDSLRCVRAVDTATHPEFRRRGIFRSLTMSGIELATESGIDLIFNTPNPASGAGYLKMGWTEVGGIGVMLRPRIGLLRQRNRDWTHTQTDSPTEAISGGAFRAAAARSPGGLRTPRSPEYLEWRFSRHPTARYVAAGDSTGAAMARLNQRHGRRELVVSELSGDRSSSAVRELLQRFESDYAVAWFSRSAPERTQAIRSGLIPVPRATALTLVARPLRELPLDVSDLRNWDVCLGDLELL